MRAIRVRIFRRKGRANYEAQWEDPISGKKKTRSTGTGRRRDAERFAARVEDELKAGTFEKTIVTWERFLQRFETEFMPSKAPRSQAKIRVTINLINRLLSPKTLTSLNEEAIAQLASHVRNAGRAEFTVKGHLATIRNMLNWAVRNKLLDVTPNIEMPNPHGMKGRPITSEEFERMLDAVPRVVGNDAATSWRWAMRAYWWSGLRLEEGLKLHWTRDTGMLVLMGERPMIQVQAHAEKGRKNRLMPVPPEFAEMLYKVPTDQRRGFVLNPAPIREPKSVRLKYNWVSKVIIKIGREANVVTKPGSYAGVHDFRRAFGFRWAQRVNTNTLKEMMRHESVRTTEEFYVGRNAEAAADQMWAAFANATANTSEVGGLVQ